MKDGKATGEYEDFLVGFVTEEGNVWGRPVGVTVAKDGALLVTDDGSNIVWRVSARREEMTSRRSDPAPGRLARPGRAGLKSSASSVRDSTHLHGPGYARLTVR